MPEIKNKDRLNQYDGGIFALLDFELDYAEGFKPETVHVVDTDTWQIHIEIPGDMPTLLTKSVYGQAEDYYFPDPTKEQVAVYFAPGELDLEIIGEKLEIRYEVVKTTGDVENHSNIRSLTLQPSLSSNPPSPPPEFPLEGAIPMFDSSGRLIESGLTIENLSNKADKLGTNETVSGTSYTLQASDLGKVKRFINNASITLTIPLNLPDGFNCAVIQTGNGQITFTGAVGVILDNPLDHTKSIKNGMVTIYPYASDAFIFQGATE